MTIYTYAADDCDLWFRKTNAKPEESNCETLCSTAPTDMGTFTCPATCPTYCKAKCALDSFLTKALNANPTPFKSLIGNDKEKISIALSKMPKNFRPKSLKAIVVSRGSDPLSRLNPASSSREFIIIFPIAFSSNKPIEQILFHELVHQMIFNEWSKALSDYKKAVFWNDTATDLPRTEGFVDPDGKDSVDEDFANNVEYFVFDSSKLKLLSPKVYSWIDKNLKSQIKLEKGCNEKTH